MLDASKHHSTAAAATWFGNRNSIEVVVAALFLAVLHLLLMLNFCLRKAKVIRLKGAYYSSVLEDHPDHSHQNDPLSSAVEEKRHIFAHIMAEMSPTTVIPTVGICACVSVGAVGGWCGFAIVTWSGVLSVLIWPLCLAQACHCYQASTPKRERKLLQPSFAVLTAPISLVLTGWLQLHESNDGVSLLPNEWFEPVTTALFVWAMFAFVIVLSRLVR